METCEICEKEFSSLNPLSQCRQCKANVCDKCIIGTKCVDCVADEKDPGGGQGRFDVRGY
jgi:hypothetical protein